MGPSPLIRKFFFNKYNEDSHGKTAIDLGCGAGNDTAFLLEKGYKVIAIDQEEQVREIIKNRNLNKENLELIIEDFSKIEIPMTDLLFANFSLFFVKNNFNDFIERLLKSINEKGFFVGNFLGKDDDWKVNGITTIEKDLKLIGVVSGKSRMRKYPNGDVVINNTPLYYIEKYSGELEYDEESKELRFFDINDLLENQHDSNLIEAYKKYKHSNDTKNI